MVALVSQKKKNLCDYVEKNPPHGLYLYKRNPLFWAS